ncbi:MAG: hypothetical protein Q4P66_07855 [Actinomycetaceae bacterium]|nr:hypothetical protein [Actinomycetaceae bacterium]
MRSWPGSIMMLSTFMTLKEWVLKTIPLKVLTTLVTICCISLILTACSSSVDSSHSSAPTSASPDTTTSQPLDANDSKGDSPPGDDILNDDSYPLEKERKDLENEVSIPWNDYKAADDHTLYISAVKGSDQCYGVRTEVQEEHDEVVITLFEGTIPDPPEQCTSEGAVVKLKVTLKEPLHDRRVVNGANIP